MSPSCTSVEDLRPPAATDMAVLEVSKRGRPSIPDSAAFTYSSKARSVSGERCTVNCAARLVGRATAKPKVRTIRRTAVLRVTAAIYLLGQFAPHVFQ